MENEREKNENSNEINHLRASSFSRRSFVAGLARQARQPWPSKSSARIHLPVALENAPQDTSKPSFNQQLKSGTFIRKPHTMPAPWHTEYKGLALERVGNEGLLHEPLLAFFSSRQCPGTAIRTATQWALQQAQKRCAVVSGFHSPLEQSVLHLLVAAGSPTVVVLARPVAGAALARAWRDALESGTMAVVSGVTRAGRLTERMAQGRNNIAAGLADRIVIAHASSAGALAKQRATWPAGGLTVSGLCTANGAAQA